MGPEGERSVGNGVAHFYAATDEAVNRSPDDDVVF